MVKQGILITPVLGEVLTNLAPLRMKHSASVPAYHKGNPTWLSLYLFACALTHRPSPTLCKGKADGNVITKTRYKIPLNQGLTLELDLFEGLFDGLVMGEVEFPEFILISMINMLPLSAICSN